MWKTDIQRGNTFRWVEKKVKSNQESCEDKVVFGRHEDKEWKAGRQTDRQTDRQTGMKDSLIDRQTQTFKNLKADTNLNSDRKFNIFETVTNIDWS